jgi:hypothetical protein
VAEGIPARLKPSELRRFALTIGGAFLALGALMYWKENVRAAWGFAGMGALLAAAGILVPARLGPVYRTWMRLGLLLSKVTTPIVLGVIYFLVVTPTGLIRRTLGHNSVERKAVDGSYWTPRKDARGDMTNQF